jgi:glycosyltransferase involved in cell wall biosynthesis
VPFSCRIAIFSMDLRIGGAEWDAINLATGLSHLGQSVNLVLGMRQGELLSEVPDEVAIRELGGARTAKIILPLRSYLKQEVPDFLITTSMLNNIAGLVARRLAKVSTRILIREVTTIKTFLPFAAGIKFRYAPAIARRVYTWSDAIVANSRTNADEMSELMCIPRDRIRVIHNPSFNAEMMGKSDEPLDHPWFVSGGPPVLISVGRLSAEKDFPTLIRAFRLVRDQRPARLVILGEGNERPVLESLVRDLRLTADVSMPGFEPNPLKYIARASLFILSSRCEGLPNVLIEALACGTPAVATNCSSGPDEILVGGRYGILVPVGDPESLASGIDKALESPIDRETLKQSAHRFSVETISKEYLEVLISTLSTDHHCFQSHSSDGTFAPAGGGGP